MTTQTMKVYEFVRAQHAATGAVPSQTDIARHMGWKNPRSVDDVFCRLVYMGLMDRVKNTEGRRRYRYELKSS